MRAVLVVNPQATATTPAGRDVLDRKSTRLNSSHSQISYAVFCLKKKTAHRRRSDLLEEDLSPHRLRFEMGDHLRSQVKAYPEGQCVDVENVLFRIDDSNDCPDAY